MTTTFADIREYVVPLFIAEDTDKLGPDEPVVVSRDRFLGTAFFVTKNGIALTAAHCVPAPSDIPPGSAFLAVTWSGTQAHAQKVRAATVVDGRDLAILKIDWCPSKYLPVSFESVHMGEDVLAVGVPLHSVSGQDYEFRCLKGNVTRMSNYVELSFPAPRGMSGSPVLRDGEVVGVVSWNARAEALEDQTEETTETFGPITRVTRTVVMAVTNYGQAEPIASLRTAVWEFSDGLGFESLLGALNTR